MFIVDGKQSLEEAQDEDDGSLRGSDADDIEIEQDEEPEGRRTCSHVFLKKLSYIAALPS